MTVERRRKHWGWGYEDEQPAPEELRAAAAGIAAHLGFGDPEPELPVALEDVELPAAAARDAVRERHLVARRARAGPLLPRRRARHARRLPAPARRRRLPAPRRTSCAPCSPGAASATWRSCRSAAARAWSAASTPGPAPATPAWWRSTCARSTACSRSTRSRARRASRPARPARGSRSSSPQHGLTLRFYPQSFELATLGGWIVTRAGGHFASGPTHIDDLVESVRALTVGGDVWESRRLPGSGAGPSPDRHAARLGGHARGRHRGVGAGAAAARAATLGERLVPRASATASTRCASSSRRACGPPTAACSTPTRPR